MSVAESFRAPTQSVFIHVALTGGARLRGSIHVPSGATSPSAGVFKLVNGPVQFVALTPGQGSSRDRTVMVHLNQVMSIEMDAPATEDPALDTTFHVAIGLPGDLLYTGSLLAPLPRSRPRLSDALNRSDRFLRMRVGGKAVALAVNFVLTVTEKD